MKYSILFLSLAMSSTVFSASIINDIQLSNLPTASKTYRKVAPSMDEANVLLSEVQKECALDKSSAEAFVVKSGSKILSSSGCKTTIEDRSYCSQAGCGEGFVVTTSFEVTFK